MQQLIDSLCDDWLEEVPAEDRASRGDSFFLNVVMYEVHLQFKCVSTIHFAYLSVVSRLRGKVNYVHYAHMKFLAIVLLMKPYRLAVLLGIMLII